MSDPLNLASLATLRTELYRQISILDDSVILITGIKEDEMALNDVQAKYRVAILDAQCQLVSMINVVDKTMLDMVTRRFKGGK
jgi:hypothetical protein